MYTAKLAPIPVDRLHAVFTPPIAGLDDPKLAEHVPAELLDQLREEVEMARELLPALDPHDPLTDALTEADQAMLAACGPLNELAIAHREGQAIPAAKRRRLPRTIAGCREATAVTQALLETLQ